AQAREHLGNARSGVLARRDRADVRLRMRCKKAQELDAGVSRTTDNADLDHQNFIRRVWTILAPASGCYDIGMEARVARKMRRPPRRRPSRGAQVGQRLENCLGLRALWRPTFFRSTSRASRVTRPAFDNVGFNAAS